MGETHRRYDSLEWLTFETIKQSAACSIFNDNYTNYMRFIRRQLNAYLFDRCCDAYMILKLRDGTVSKLERT